jgi:hypothetical protein
MTAQPIPEALGPGTELGNGTILWGQPSAVKAGPMPLPTPEERERELAATAALIARCTCAPVPSGVLGQLADLARRAGVSAREGAGCPRCRQIPGSLVDSLAEALEEARQEAQ